MLDVIRMYADIVFTPPVDSLKLGSEMRSTDWLRVVAEYLALDESERKSITKELGFD